MILPTRPVVAVCQFATQPQGTLHQVTVRPDKVKGKIIRFGETPNDEYNGWQYIDSIEVVQELGFAVKDGEVWKCVPEISDALDTGSI